MMVADKTARRVAVSGMGVCTPAGNSVAKFRNTILGGRTTIQKVNDFDTSDLTSNLASMFAGDMEYTIPKSLQSVVDKASLSTYTAYLEAIKDANVDFDAIDPRRIAVVVGSSHAGIDSTENIYRKMLNEKTDSLDHREVFSILTSSVGNIICSHLGATGPRLTVSSACASSNGALGIAFDLIAAGEADCVIVAGTDTVSLAIMAGFSALRALSAELTAPFSNPPGLNLGEGAGVFVVEPLDAIQSRMKTPHAEILGYALSSDAYHVTAPDLEGEGAELAMRTALADAKMDASAIDYVSAHGTGTNANDKPESIATWKVFGERVPVSSPKSYIGHTLGASGILEMLITILYAKEGQVPPTVNFTGTREGCMNLNYVPNSPASRSVQNFCCNNFGFGGNNASLIMSIGEGKNNNRRIAEKRVVIVGGGSVTHLGHEPEDFAAALRNNQDNLGFTPSDIPELKKVSPFKFTKPELIQFARSAPMMKYGLKATLNAVGEQTILFQNNIRSGIIGGMFNGSSTSIERYFESVFVDGPGLASAQQFPMTTVNACASQIAIAFGIKGYITTMCGGSGGLYYARDLVKRSRQDAVLAVASDDFTPRVENLFRSLKVNGTLGEGATALALESRETAVARNAAILCELAGMAQGQGAVLYGPAKSGTLLAKITREALDEAQISTDSIDLVIATSSMINRIFSNTDGAIKKLFPNGIRTITIDRLTGYSPSNTSLLNVYAAALYLNGDIEKNSSINTVLVLDSDISGIDTACVLKKHR